MINSPQPNTGFIFEAILNGRGSHSAFNPIILYSWTAIDNFGSITINSPNLDTSKVIFYASGGITKFRFRLEVRDDHDNVDYDTVAITVNRKFFFEYDGIPWDSTVGSLTYIRLDDRFGNRPSFGGTVITYNTYNLVYLCNFNGKCDDISGWESIPFGPYDSIKLTDRNLFYSSDELLNWFVIYATPNAEIDFTQKQSMGVYSLE